MNKRPWFGTLVYTTIAAIYLISTSREFDEKVDAEYVKRGIKTKSSFGGKYKYLTMLNLYAHTIYFFICTLNSLYELATRNQDQSRFLKRFINFLYTTLMFPVGMCVCVQFWGIYFIDRDLIFPKIFDEVIPAWHNHVMHTLPLVGDIFDTIVTKHTYKKSFFWGVLPTLISGVSYLIWIIIVAHYGKFWVYPILDVLGPFYRAIFFIFSILILAGFYQLGKILNSIIWKETSPMKKKEK